MVLPSPALVPAFDPRESTICSQIGTVVFAGPIARIAARFAARFTTGNFADNTSRSLNASD
jgi:hypothetical protein